MFSRPLFTRCSSFSRLVPRSLSSSSFSPRSLTFRPLSPFSSNFTPLVSFSSSALSTPRFRPLVSLFRSSSDESNDKSSSGSSYSGFPRLFLFTTAGLFLVDSLHTIWSTPLSNAAIPAAIPSSPIPLNGLSVPFPVAGEDVEIAPLWRRLCAFLVDNTIISIFYQIIDITFIGAIGVWLTPVAILFNLAYETLLTGYNDGRTVGKWVCGIRVANDDGTSVNPKVALGIWAGKLLNLFFGLDVLWALVDVSGDRKALHNYFTGTIVVMDRTKQDKNE
jgi:uncharacterized RDD family membrane protein YckC